MPGTTRIPATAALRDLLAGATGAAPDDEALLARFARDRDEAAFAALVERYGPLVLATTRAVLRHDQDAEDAFQATFLALALRAHAIRSGSTLAAWLHRVARRAAVRVGRAARRRRQVEAAAAPVPARPADPDRAAALHAALDRLPRPYRLAVILCDLEGHTYAEAAARLGCTEAALRNRLARARARLRASLGRADLAVPILALSRLGIPQHLFRATTALATGRGASTSELLARACRGGPPGSLRVQPMIAALVAVLAVAAVTVLAPGGDLPRNHADESDPRSPRAIVPTVPPLAAPAVARGRVVAPDGRPIAGAEVTLRSLDPRETTWPTARSGPDGRYVLVPPPGWRGPAVTQFRALLAATAAGYGAGWAYFDEGPGDTEIGLVDEGPPIEGRILDEAGRPVGGARVIAGSIHVAHRRIGEAKAAAFDRLLAGRDGVVTLGLFERVPLAIRATTASNGRFILRGIGADRIATLEVSGPTLATTEVEATTRGGGERKLVGGGFHGEERTLHPNRFDWTVPPTRIIAGTVRDADSGAPLIGWRVGGSYQRDDTLGAGETACPTDAVGRYRLVGLPAAPWYTVTMTPPPGEPYLDASFTVDAPGEGAAPVTFDATLRRGVVVRGRVTDGATGAPIPGRIRVMPFPGRPANTDHPEFESSGGIAARSGADGRYELVAPAGRTLLTFRADRREPYQPGRGAEDLPSTDPAGRQIWTGAHKIVIWVHEHDLLVPLDLPELSRTARFDFQLTQEPGVELAIHDAMGAPLAAEAGAIAVHSPRFSVIRDGMRLILRGSRPGDSRRVLVWHRARKLAGAVDAVADGPPQSVHLAPWGEVRGRIVAADGAPRGAIPLVAGPCAGPDAPPVPVGYPTDLPGLNADPTDPAGRFRIEGLVPGIRYGLIARERGRRGEGDQVADVTLAPGEVHDLGDIVVRPGAPPPGP